MNHVLRRIVHHGDFFQHHAPLLVQFLLIEDGPKRQIGKNIHRKPEILVDHLGIKAGAFLAGKGVQLAAHHVHFFSDLPGSAVLCSLEDHVLDKVAQAVFFGQFVDAAHLDPHAHRTAVNVAELFAHHPQAVWQSDLIEHNHFLSLKGRRGRKAARFQALVLKPAAVSLVSLPSGAIVSAAEGTSIPAGRPVAASAVAGAGAAFAGSGISDVVAD